jgi:hypothetical protein
MALVSWRMPIATLLRDAASIVTTTRFTVRDVRWLASVEQHLPALSQEPHLSYARRLQRSPADFEDVAARLQACARARR